MSVYNVNGGPKYYDDNGVPTYYVGPKKNFNINMFNINNNLLTSELNCKINKLDFENKINNLIKVDDNLKTKQEINTIFQEEIKSWDKNPKFKRLELAVFGLACLASSIALVAYVVFTKGDVLLSGYRARGDTAAYAQAGQFFLDMAYIGVTLIGAGLGVYFSGQSIFRNSSNLKQKLEANQVKIKQIKKNRNEIIKEMQNLNQHTQQIKNDLDQKIINYKIEQGNVKGGYQDPMESHIQNLEKQAKEIDRFMQEVVKMMNAKSNSTIIGEVFTQGLVRFNPIGPFGPYGQIDI